MNFFQTSDNVNIHYDISGKGIPIVFIHGFGENGDVFRIQKRTLSKKYRIITYDIRGHGKSDIVEYGLNMNRLSIDLKELIDYLGVNRLIIVAWSMGASILLEYIKNFGTDQLHKICIVDKSPKMLNDESWNLGIYGGKYNIENLKNDLKLLREDFPKFSKEFIEKMSLDLNEKEIEIALEKMNKNSPKVLHCLWKSMGESDYRDILKDIDIDTLIVFGKNSCLYSIETGEYLRESIKQSRLEVFPENGHLLILENPKKFNKILDDFIGNEI